MDFLYKNIGAIIYVFLLICSAAVLFLENTANRFSVVKRYYRFKNVVAGNAGEIFYQEKLEKNGFKLSLAKEYRYIVIGRTVIMAIAVVVAIFKIVTTGIVVQNILILLALLCLTTTEIKVGKLVTPTGYILKAIDVEHKKRQDKELAVIVVQLQNIAIGQKSQPTTLANMLIRVIRFSNYTKEAFTKMDFYIDIGQKEKARDAFVEEINTQLSRDLGYLIVKLDDVEPSEMVWQLKILEERVDNNERANKDNREEMYSNIMYLVPIILCFIILINFLSIILGVITSNSLVF